MSHPWERLETEHDEAWAVFKEYRDQNHNRNPYQGNLARRLGREKVHTYYNEFNWKERILAHDRYYDAIEQEAKADSIRQIQKEAGSRRKIMLDELLAVAEKGVAKLKEAMEHDGPVLRPGETVKIVEAAVKLGALLDGQPTEILGTVDKDYDQLSPEELRKLIELDEKTKKR